VKLELFRCAPLAVKLTRSSCAARHERAAREQRHEGARRVEHLVGANRCATCEIGAAHVRGELPSTWPDGAPLELCAPINVPEPGRSKWLGSSSTSEDTDPPRGPETATTTTTSNAEDGMARPAKTHTHNGKTLTIEEWANEPEVHSLGVTRDMIWKRLQQGWKLQDALSQPKGHKVPKRARIAEQLEEAVRPSKPKPSPKPSKAKTLEQDALEALDAVRELGPLSPAEILTELGFTVRQIRVPVGVALIVEEPS
jgi:hypothetical protein